MAPSLQRILEKGFDEPVGQLQEARKSSCGFATPPLSLEFRILPKSFGEAGCVSVVSDILLCVRFVTFDEEVFVRGKAFSALLPLLLFFGPVSLLLTVLLYG